MRSPLEVAQRASWEARVRYGRLRQAARFAPPIAARGGFPYFGRRPQPRREAAPCGCRECERLDRRFPGEGIQLRLPL